jgi:hypothetical protein
MGVGGQRHAPAALPPRKTRYPFYRRLGGPQGRYGWCGKSRPRLGFDPRTVQPIAGLFVNQEVQISSTECLVKYCSENLFYSIIGCHRTVTHLCVVDQNTRSSIPGYSVIRLWNEDGVHHGGGTVHVFHRWTKVYWIQWWRFIYLYSDETNTF